MGSGPKRIADQVVHTGDHLQRDMQQLGRDITSAFNVIPFLRGRAIDVQFQTAGARLIVDHKIGKPASCFPIRWNHHPNGLMAGPTFAEWNDQTGLDQNNQLAVVASAICQVTLWFYPRINNLVIPTGGTQSP